MFGYILPEKPHLYLKDLELYQAFYCGVCKSMGANFCKRSQFAINYDITFFCSLVHNYLGEDIEMDKLSCVTKPFSDRKMVVDNPLTKLCGALNVLLANHKLVDDVIDGAKKRKVLLGMFKKSYKKAVDCFPKADEIISLQYQKLRDLENVEAESVDRVSDTFGVMLQSLLVATVEEFARISGKEFPEVCIHFKSLCYNLGKWIYLIDAVDDLQSDHESGNYNVFLAGDKEFVSKADYLARHAEDLSFTFQTTLNAIKEHFLQIEFKFNTDLVENIIFRGMDIATRSILKGEVWNNFTKS